MPGCRRPIWFVKASNWSDTNTSSLMLTVAVASALVRVYWPAPVCVTVIVDPGRTMDWKSAAEM